MIDFTLYRMFCKSRKLKQCDIKTLNKYIQIIEK